VGERGRRGAWWRGSVRSGGLPKPRLWASWRPNGLGLQKPNHYADMAKVVWANKANPLYAWRVLSKGVCDGCALGVAGFNDWTIHGTHLCTTRLNLLRTNTMGALDPKVLGDVAALREKTSAELRDLGRLPFPMVRHRGDAGFRRVSWDDALDLVAGTVRAAVDAGEPDRFGVYLTARGITNEVYYAAQKAVRAVGTNNVDNAARICHSPSTGVLKRSVGAAATTISYTDLFESDLIVLFGSQVANAQPVMMKYLYLARKRGAKVAVVNPLREPGLERYWVPSNVESAMFGTLVADEFFAVHTGGDVAFINGVLKVLARSGGLDRTFIDSKTAGWPELEAALDAQSLADLERLSGASRADMERFAELYASARSAILVWSMGITQHETGTDNVQAVVNLGLARGNIGRVGAGLMPIRGHSGVQGGAEMGAYATAFPGGVPITAEKAAELGEQWGFPVRAEEGLSAPELLDAARAGRLDVLWSMGGNFLEALPDPALVQASLEAVPVRVHQDIVLSSQMLVDPGEVVVLLPATTRYEQPGGGTETTTERRIAFSPEIPGRRIGEARSEWEVFGDFAARVRPDLADKVRFTSAQAIRDEIARVVPLYDGIQHLSVTGDQVQWGGTRLCEGQVFPTDDGLAHFSALRPRELELPPDRFLCSTRRGKQFNTMVFAKTDPLTGAGRDAVLVAASDAERLGIADGERVLLRSEHGEMDARVRISPLRPGNVQVMWPEGNVLLGDGRRDAASHVPDYNALVEIVPQVRTRIPVTSG
jgi:molybdopterin-dependent oxidoreductase alpha subunit